MSFTVALMQWLGIFVVGALMMRMTFDEIKQSYAENNEIDIGSVSDADVISYMKAFLEIEECERHLVTMAYITNEVTCNSFLPAFSDVIYSEEDEGRFHWEAVTGIRGLSLSENKRLKSLEVRMKIYPGARCEVSIMYDEDGRFENIASFDTAGMSTYRMNGRLNKCDSYRLRFSGYGKVVIFSIGETYEEAGNIGF